MQVLVSFINDKTAMFGLTARQTAIIAHAAELAGAQPYEGEVTFVIPIAEPTYVTEPSAEFQQANKRAKKAE